MSFYLLPPVSYQTHQKLKNKMNEEKKKLATSKQTIRKKSVSTLSTKSKNSSRQQSIGSPGSIMLNTYDTPSSLSRDSIICSDPMRELINSNDELSSLEEISITFDDASNCSLSGSYPNDDEDCRKSINSAYNYSCNSDINEILSFNKQRQRRKSAKRSNSRFSNSDSINESLSSLSINDYNDRVIFNDVDFQGRIVMKKDNLAEEEEENSKSDNLTRVYSNVSSIFSTKQTTTPSSKNISKLFSSKPRSNDPKTEVISDSNVHTSTGNGMARRLKKRFT